MRSGLQHGSAHRGRAGVTPRTKGRGEGRWKSLKTGKFVSAYYAKRNLGRVARIDAPRSKGEGVAESKLQHTEIPLYAEHPGLECRQRGTVIIEPGGDPFRSVVQLQVNLDGLHLHRLSPEEAYTIGSSLVEHAIECGYDPDQ